MRGSPIGESFYNLLQQINTALAQNCQAIEAGGCPADPQQTRLDLRDWLCQRLGRNSGPFVDFIPSVLIPLCTYLRSGCFGQCTSISFIDSTPKEPPGAVI